MGDVLVTPTPRRAVSHGRDFAEPTSSSLFPDGELPQAPGRRHADEETLGPAEDQGDRRAPAAAVAGESTLPALLRRRLHQAAVGTCFAGNHNQVVARSTGIERRGHAAPHGALSWLYVGTHRRSASDPGGWSSASCGDGGPLAGSSGLSGNTSLV
jgi:hypothetical protein